MVSTVNVAVQDLGTSQSLVTVNVTVFDPPHSFGAPLLLLLTTGLHPPVIKTPFNQLLNLVLISFVFDRKLPLHCLDKSLSVVKLKR